MNIDKMKQQHDENIAYQDKIKLLQDGTIEKFESFFKVMDESYSIWNVERKRLVDKLIKDFKNYFIENDFNIEVGNPFGYNGIITEINANYKGLKFKLANINYDGEPIYFSNYDNINEEIMIKFHNSFPDYFTWKDNIEIGDKRLVDMNGPAKEIYKDFVKKVITKEEIDELMEKVCVNINHFQESIDKANNIYLCIYRCNTGDEYRNFKEFIEDIENVDNIV